MKAWIFAAVIVAAGAAQAQTARFANIGSDGTRIAFMQEESFREGPGDFRAGTVYAYLPTPPSEDEPALVVMAMEFHCRTRQARSTHLSAFDRDIRPTELYAAPADWGEVWPGTIPGRALAYACATRAERLRLSTPVPGSDWREAFAYMMRTYNRPS